MPHRALKTSARRLVQKEVAVFRFDKRGAGDSDGVYQRGLATSVCLRATSWQPWFCDSGYQSRPNPDRLAGGESGRLDYSNSRDALRTRRVHHTPVGTGRHRRAAQFMGRDRRR